jgi:hypothetical protein
LSECLFYQTWNKNIFDIYFIPKHTAVSSPGANFSP